MSMKRNGFTLVELMIVVGVLGILITLAAPSMYDFILTQRLKGISAQISTDLQFARSEATSRNQNTHVRFSDRQGEFTCYMIYTSDAESAAATTETSANICDCSRTPRCPAALDVTEIRTVFIPTNLKVRVTQAGNFLPVFTMDRTTGAILVPSADIAINPPRPYVIDATVDTRRSLRTMVSLGGRPLTCATPGSSVGSACP
jgi:type IV fimbrial biogenesis protein FimT